MLKVFRDNLKYLSWVLWLVIGVFFLFVFTDFGGTVPGGTRANEFAASVGDLEVSYGEFERAYRQVEDGYRQQIGEQFDRDMASRLGLPIQVLNQLVSEKLLQQEARQMGLQVSDEELRDELLEIPGLQQNGEFVGEEVYRNVLRANGFTTQEFEDSLRGSLLAQKMRDVLAQSVFVSNQEVEEAYRESAETAEIRYVKLPAARFAAQVEPTAEEVEEFFGERSDEYRLPERRSVRYLLVEPSALQGSVEVSDEDVNAFYRENQDRYRQEDQVKARHILIKTSDEVSLEQARGTLEEVQRQLAAGADFGELAIQYSDDPGSKDKGGELEFFGRGAMVPPFEQAAFGAEPGSVVGPVETNFGVHLIEVLAKRPAGLQPLEEVSAGIRTQLAAERSRQQAEEIANELAEQARAENPDADTLGRWAERAGVFLNSTSPFARDDNVEGVGRATAFTVTAFDLEGGEWSEAVQIPRGWAVLGEAEVHPPRLPDLHEVVQEVEADLRSARQLDLAEQQLQGLREGLAGGGDFDQLAEGLDLTVVDAGPFSISQPITGFGPNSEVARRALEAESGHIEGPFAQDQEAVLFEVTDRTHFEPTQFAAERDSTRERLEGERFEQLLTSWVMQRQQELGVRYDPAIFENFGLDAPAGP